MQLFGIDTKHITNKLSWFQDISKPQASSRAWSMLVGIGFILLVVVSVLCVLIFLQVQSGEFASTDEDGQVDEIVSLEREELNEAVSNLQKRRATFDLLRDRQPDIPNLSR